MGIKAGTKHAVGISHNEVLKFVRTASAGDELRADKGLYLRCTDGGHFWVFRYTSPVTGKQARAQLWADDERGVIGFPQASLEEARRRAGNLRAKVADGIDPVQAAEQARKDAEQAAALERQRIADDQRQREAATQAAEIAQARRLTVRRLFDDWRAVDLQPRVRADGKRVGRVDGGQYVMEQFARHVFPAIGAIALDDLRKADLMALLDAQKAAGKMRTANVLLAELKQMLDFAAERELIPANPLGTVKKTKVGGADVARERNLSDEEISLLGPAIASARLHPRNATAIWLTLATGVRIGELLGAVWADDLPTNAKRRTARLDALKAITEAEGEKLGVIDTTARTWYLPDTKNQRDHTIHLSAFALAQLEVLRQYREALIDSTTGELSPWLFPATDNSRPRVRQVAGQATKRPPARARAAPEQPHQGRHGADAAGRQVDGARPEAHGGHRHGAAGLPHRHDQRGAEPQAGRQDGRRLHPRPARGGSGARLRCAGRSADGVDDRRGGYIQRGEPAGRLTEQTRRRTVSGKWGRKLVVQPAALTTTHLHNR